MEAGVEVTTGIAPSTAPNAANGSSSMSVPPTTTTPLPLLPLVGFPFGLAKKSSKTPAGIVDETAGVATEAEDTLDADGASAWGWHDVLMSN